MIEIFYGTVGSGKSYHALERIVEALSQGRYVVANFPLNFTDGMKRRGYADRFMYVPDEFLMGEQGVSFLFQLQKKMEFFEKGGEGTCLVVIDEAGNYFPPEDNSKPETRLWKLFFTQSRKMGYDFILVCQDYQSQINRTIRKCAEYLIGHRKANAVYPFKLLDIFGIVIFMYVTFWNAGNRPQRLGSESSFYVKRFGALYDTSRMFGGIDGKFDLDLESLRQVGFELEFGNCT